MKDHLGPIWAVTLVTALTVVGCSTPSQDTPDTSAGPLTSAAASTDFPDPCGLMSAQELSGLVTASFAPGVGNGNSEAKRCDFAEVGSPSPEKSAGANGGGGVSIVVFKGGKPVMDNTVRSLGGKDLTEWPNSAAVLGSTAGIDSAYYVGRDIHVLSRGVYFAIHVDTALIPDDDNALRAAVLIAREAGKHLS